MHEIERFLERVGEKPALFLGKKDLRALSYSLASYESAIYDLTGKRVLFHTKFQRFTEKKLPQDSGRTVHWSAMLLNGRSEEAAFDLFFELWAEFLKQHPHWEEEDHTLF